MSSQPYLFANVSVVTNLCTLEVRPYYALSNLCFSNKKRLFAADWMQPVEVEGQQIWDFKLPPATKINADEFQP